MKYLVLFFTIMVAPTLVSANDAAPMQAVKDLFAAMSARDGDAMRKTSTSDFELLEVGELWNMDKLISAILSGSSDWKRRNYFAVITSRVHGNNAWVSYWNKATFSGPENGKSQRRWLESAVLLKVGGAWKIEQLHSTRLQQDQIIPETFVMEEYIPSNP